jgi:hypothetical protein
MEYHVGRNSMSEVVEHFDEVGKLGQGFSIVDELEEGDLGEEGITRPTYVNVKLPSDKKAKVCSLLKEFVDCFTWDNTEMPD